jgi:two-component system sensor histidine kinase DesK
MSGPAVARDEHIVSLNTELDSAAALLSAAGTTARIDADLADLARPVEETLAWAVREGVANILQHSGALACSITAARQNGTVRLEIVNDRAHPLGGEGHGLAGLTERAHALSGIVRRLAGLA